MKESYKVDMLKKAVQEGRQKYKHILQQSSLNAIPPSCNRSMSHVGNPQRDFLSSNGVIKEIILQMEILKSIKSARDPMIND
jgi:hypothetical protein